MSSPDPTTLVSELLTETKNKAVADVIEAERNRIPMIDKKYQLKEVIIYVKRNIAQTRYSRITLALEQEVSVTEDEQSPLERMQDDLNERHDELILNCKSNRSGIMDTNESHQNL